MISWPHFVCLKSFVYCYLLLMSHATWCFSLSHWFFSSHFHSARCLLKSIQCQMLNLNSIHILNKLTRNKKRKKNHQKKLKLQWKITNTFTFIFAWSNPKLIDQYENEMQNENKLTTFTLKLDLSFELFFSSLFLLLLSNVRCIHNVITKKQSKMLKPIMFFVSYK